MTDKLNFRQKTTKPVPIYLSAEQIKAQFETERIVIGCIVLTPEVLFEIGSEFGEHLFEDPQHKLLAKALTELWRTEQPIDFVTIIKHLRECGDFDKISGGVSYISSITSYSLNPANIEVYIRILQQYHLARYINNVCEQTKVKILQNDDVFDIYEELQTDLSDALKSIVRSKVSSIGEMHHESIKMHMESSGKKVISGIPTGLMQLDRVTNGFQDTDLIIVAGRPAMGKTASILSSVLFPAVELDIPIAIFSLEMSKMQLLGRLQSQLSGIDVSKIIKKQLSESEIELLDVKCRKLNTAPIFIDDTPSISIAEFKTKARKLVREHGVREIIVDYLQLMRAGIKTGNREQEIAEISRALKHVAKELNIPVIALSQLNRSVETRGGDKKPSLADLRESGQIEQDADLIMFCYRPEYYQFDETEIDGNVVPTKGLFLFLIAKHRNGGLGDIPLKFIHHQAKVTNHENHMPLGFSYNELFKEKNKIDLVEQKTVSKGMTPNASFDNEKQANVSFEDFNNDSNTTVFTYDEDDMTPEDDVPF